MAFCSFLYGSFFYLYIIYARNPKPSNKRLFLPENLNELAMYWKCSCFVILSTFFGIICMKMVPISIFAFLFNLKPVLVIFFGFCMGQETLTLKKFGYISLSFLGTGLIVDSPLFISCYHWIFGIEPASPSQTNSQIVHGNPIGFWRVNPE